MARILEGSNRATAQEAASFADKLIELEVGREEKLRVLDAEFKAKKREINKAVNEDQKAILDDAKKVGVGKGVLRALGKKASDLRKAAAIQERAEGRLDELEDDDRDYAIDIAKSLGVFADTPLGAAAVAAGKPDATTAAVVAAVKADANDEEWDQAGRAAARVTGGLTPPI